MIDWKDEEGAPGGWGGGAEAARDPWAEDPDAWRRGGVRDRIAWGPGDTDDVWRGSAHFREWPVWDAGPEYHMWKRMAEQDDAITDDEE
jgi:hypothetical protein